VRTEQELRELLRQKAQEVPDDATIPPRVVLRARIQRVVTAAVASIVVVTASFGAVAAFRAGFGEPDVQPISSPPPSFETDAQGFAAVHSQVLAGGTYTLWVRRDGDALCVRHTYPGDQFLEKHCGAIPQTPEDMFVVTAVAGDRRLVAVEAPRELQRATVELTGGGRADLRDVVLPPRIGPDVRVVVTTAARDAVGCVTARFPGGVVERRPLRGDRPAPGEC
jgi:hypothetical protein